MTYTFKQNNKKEMKTYDCCKEWTERCVELYKLGYNHKILDIKLKATNVHATGNKLYSYSTPICIFHEGTFYYSEKKYSISTSKHQNYMRGCVSNVTHKYDCEIDCRQLYDINESPIIREEF